MTRRRVSIDELFKAQDEKMRRQIAEMKRRVALTPEERKKEDRDKARRYEEMWVELDAEEIPNEDEKE